MSEKVNHIIALLKSKANAEAIQGMARFGITPGKVFGVSIPELRKMGKQLGKDHELAGELWDAKYRETMILAALVEEPARVTDDQMESWVNDFYDWEICDQCIMNLFEKKSNAYDKAVQWAERDEEFVKRAGYVLMARLAVSDKTAPDKKFLPFFPFIKHGATDDRNFVKKAVNWALRQIGKRNVSLNAKAIELGKEILTMDSKSARWIATDALRELTGDAVQARLKQKQG
ncbi:DNA alkylation repair protein [candidate division KSB1 bacterium]|nr:DNA alkylation repair protein [candidate division KSB1 bacterium]